MRHLPNLSGVCGRMTLYQLRRLRNYVKQLKRGRRIMHNDSAALPQPAQEAVAHFSTAFADGIEYMGPSGAAWAPGRVNLIGEHTDYNDGFVLPLAVDRVATFAGRARSDTTVRLWSSHFQEYTQFSLDGLPGTFQQQRADIAKWARYALAVISELTRAGITTAGFDAVVGGDVPLGGGLSSSAAFEVATARRSALFSVWNFIIDGWRAYLR